MDNKPILLAIFNPETGVIFTSDSFKDTPKTIIMTAELTQLFMEAMCTAYSHLWIKGSSRWKCHRCGKRRRAKRYDRGWNPSNRKQRLGV